MNNKYNISDDNEFYIHHFINQTDVHERGSEVNDIDIYVERRGIPKERMTREQFLTSCKSIEPECVFDRTPFIDYDKPFNQFYLKERFPFNYINRIKIMYMDEYENHIGEIYCDDRDIFKLTCRKNGVNLRISEKGLKIMYDSYCIRNPLNVTYHSARDDNPFFGNTAPIQIDFYRAFIHRMVNAVMLCIMLDDGIPYRQCTKHLRQLTYQSVLLIMRKKTYEYQNYIKHDSEISRYFKSRLNPRAHEGLMDLFWEYCVKDPI